MKLRVGETASRFTTDFDAARAANATVEDYIDEFDQRLFDQANAGGRERA